MDIGWSNGGGNQTMTGQNPGVTSSHNTPELPGAGQGYGGSDPHWTPAQQQAYANAGSDEEKAAIGQAAWQNYDQRRATSTAIRNSYGGGGGSKANSGSGGYQPQYDSATKSWSVYDPTAGKWKTGITQDNLQANLPDYWKNARPDWQWDAEADQADYTQQRQSDWLANDAQNFAQMQSPSVRYMPGVSF
jgi:hypothetical protein